jgi:hypothetical protein
MACKLTPFPNPPPDFTAATGETVTIGVTGAAAVIQSAVYDGTVLPSPYHFTVGGGERRLEVVVANLAGDRTQIRELCGDGTSNVLLDFNFDPGAPLQIFSISGT